MEILNSIIRSNRAWAKGNIQADPNYYAKMALAQNPKMLWIGCSDSRVSSAHITASEPGEIFEFRNIANQVRDQDPSINAVVQYAIEYLKIGHLVVCGHYECGGIMSAIGPDVIPDPLKIWLGPLLKVKDAFSEKLNLFEGNDRINTLSRLNVIEQVRNLTLNDVIRSAWGRGKKVFVHGIMFNIHTGLLEDLDVTSSCPTDMELKYNKAILSILN